MHKIILSVTAILGASAAAAGTYVESSGTNSYSPQPLTAKMWVDNGRFRMEMQQGQQVQIFKDQTIYTVFPAKKTYSKLDQAAMDAVMKKASDATNDLYALLPPEERKKME